VTVGSHSAEFVQHDPLGNLNISNVQDCHNHPELKRRLYATLAEEDEAGLSIAIPKEVSLQQSVNSYMTGFTSECKSVCEECEWSEDN
jgi:transcription initiation factor TFIID subunit 2